MKVTMTLIVGISVDKNTTRKLNLFVIPKQKSIALADTNQHAKIVGEAVVDFSLNNATHSGIIVEIIKDLIIDVVIGKDILKKNTKWSWNLMDQDMNS